MQIYMFAEDCNIVSQLRMLRLLIVSLLISSVLGVTYKIFEAHTEEQYRPTYTLELVLAALLCIFGLVPPSGRSM